MTNYTHGDKIIIIRFSIFVYVCDRFIIHMVGYATANVWLHLQTLFHLNQMDNRNERERKFYTRTNNEQTSRTLSTKNQTERDNVKIEISDMKGIDLIQQKN